MRFEERSETEMRYRWLLNNQDSCLALSVLGPIDFEMNRKHANACAFLKEGSRLITVIKQIVV